MLLKLLFVSHNLLHVTFEHKFKPNLKKKYIQVNVRAQHVYSLFSLAVTILTLQLTVPAVVPT